MINLDTPKKYFMYIVRQYMIRIRKGIGMTEQQFETKINNMKVDASRTFSENEIKELEDILRNFYAYVTEDSIDKKIKDGEITEEFLEKLFYNENNEHIEEKPKVQYKVTLEILKNDSIILKDSNGKNKIRFIDIPNSCIHKYSCRNGKCIEIQEIGRIIYMHSNNFENDISKYRIVIIDNNGQSKVIEVYSNLRITNMDNEEYRSIVLDYLLGDNNLELLSYDGYIGEIEPKTDYDEKINHKIVNGELTHIITENYVLRYKSEDLTAVSLYEELRKNSYRTLCEYKSSNTLNEKKGKIGEAR